MVVQVAGRSARWRTNASVISSSNGSAVTTTDRSPLDSATD
ncbi:MAG: hypothetical protein R2710_16340 [Acidimicrobiales bacterium]